VSSARQPLTVEQEPFLVARTYATQCSSGHLIPPHSHDWRQLVYATTGAMTVTGGRRVWIGATHFVAGLLGCEHPFDAG